jgi:hypothetical protein
MERGGLILAFLASVDRDRILSVLEQTSAVPTGLGSSLHSIPALKRGAKLVRPSGAYVLLSGACVLMWRRGSHCAIRLPHTLREKHAKDGAPTAWLCQRKAGHPPGFDAAHWRDGFVQSTTFSFLMRAKA